MTTFAFKIGNLVDLQYKGVDARSWRGKGIMRPDVVFTVIFLKDGIPLASPTVLGEFGREVRVELPNLMRALVLALAPNQEGRSFTSAKMAILQDNAWQPPEEMSMEAYLSMTPSFEYSVRGTPYRFVVMPRRIVPAANETSHDTRSRCWELELLRARGHGKGLFPNNR